MFACYFFSLLPCWFRYGLEKHSTYSTSGLVHYYLWLSRFGRDETVKNSSFAANYTNFRELDKKFV